MNARILQPRNARLGGAPFFPNSLPSSHPARIPTRPLARAKSCWAAALLIIPTAQATPVDFSTQVQPIFEKHCHGCHGPEKQKAGLRLDLKSEAFKPGDSQQANLIPGRAEQSPLIHYISGNDPNLQMPPKGEKLSPKEIALLRRWIDEGAHWPEAPLRSPTAPTPKVDKADWWCFHPLQTPEAGPHSVDLFLADKLREKGLQFSPETDRRTLLRRLSLVVHGLPPSSEDVEAFLHDPSPEAYTRRVDAALASKHYGEKWAQHWLDCIGWGETHGFEINTPRPNAWPFRDYVIEAFNRDIPYPQFILEQLAGDTVGENRATGFLMAKAALLPGQIGKDKESKDRARQDELNDMVSTTGAAFLGMTLQCARCHDHKFDPITQRDYYGLHAVFSGIQNGDRPLHPKYREPWAAELMEETEALALTTHALLCFEPLAESGAPREPVRLDRNIERFTPVSTRLLRFTVTATIPSGDAPALDEIEVLSTTGRNVALASLGGKITVHNCNEAALSLLNDGRYGEKWRGHPMGPWSLEIALSTHESVEAIVWSVDRLHPPTAQRHGKTKGTGLPWDYHCEALLEDGHWKTVASSNSRKKPDLETTGKEVAPRQTDGERKRSEAAVLALEERIRKRMESRNAYSGVLSHPVPIFRLHRGDVTQPREETGPSVIGKIAPLGVEFSNSLSSEQRRVALARWIASPENPLTARVMVNRIWQRVFGEGLVSTPSDFGHNGSPPSHPELLDWLASEFIASGWSVKHIERLLLLSHAFRQSGRPHPAALAVDADTRLLWRYPSRRMDAEGIRDNLLRAAGNLDLTMGGPGFLVFKPNNSGVRVYEPKDDFNTTDWRRMIYMTRIRVAQDGTFGAFDCPDATQDQPRRQRSTTAIQALNLFNSSFVIQQSQALAHRVRSVSSTDTSSQVHAAFRLSLQRPPTKSEQLRCKELVDSHGLPALCRVLLNTSEMLQIP